MTTTNSMKQSQLKRMKELSQIARQRYLDAGGNRYRSAHGNEWFNEDEEQEYLALARQVFAPEAIALYVNEQGSWRDRLLSQHSVSV